MTVVLKLMALTEPVMLSWLGATRRTGTVAVVPATGDPIVLVRGGGREGARPRYV
jgi:hypothetical protein